MNDPSSEFLSTVKHTALIRAMRSLARSLVYEHDADDVVQDACVIAIARENLRHEAWLTGVVRNLAHKSWRTAGRRERRETAAVPLAAPPQPDELAEQLELQQAITRAVLALDEPYREIVTLRFWHDMLPAEIAARRDVSVHTVKTQLQRAIGQLRSRLDKERDRKEWIAILVPWVGPAAAPRVAIHAGGKSLTKLVLVMLSSISLSLVILFGLFDLGDSSSPLPSSKAESSAVAPLALPEGTPANDRTRVPGAQKVHTGSLVITVIHKSDHRAAANIGLRVFRPDDVYPSLSPLLIRTDGSGLANLEVIESGRFVVATDRHTQHLIEIIAGRTTHLQVALPRGVDLSGLVVDKNGTAIAGARVEVARGSSLWPDARVLAMTGKDGRFVVSDAPLVCMIGARAENHAPSFRQRIKGSPGEAVEVRLLLLGSGGSVTGRVVNPAGEPVAGALVNIGTRFASWSDTRSPFETRTDMNGSFSATGLPLGDTGIDVRSRGFAPWSGKCLVSIGEASLLVTLREGVSYAGTVEDVSGNPIEGVEIRSGETGSIQFFHTTSSSTGSYRLTGLPEGTIELIAKSQDFGLARAKLSGVAGTSVAWDPNLSLMRTVRVVVRSTSGEPLPGVFVTAAAPAQKRSKTQVASWFQSGQSNARGEFLAKGCPHSIRLAVQVQKKGYIAKQIQVIDPITLEVNIQMESSDPTVHVVGIVVDPVGRPVGHVRVIPTRRGSVFTRGAVSKAKTGEVDFHIPSGSYKFAIEAHGYPRVVIPERELAAHERLDLGVVQLIAGGRLNVKFDGLPSSELAGVTGTVFDEKLNRCAWLLGDGEMRTQVLIPGKYFVSIRGSGIASQWLPVELASGNPQLLTVKAISGEERILRFHTLPGTGRIHVTVSGRDGVVSKSWVTCSQGVTEIRRGFAPGHYVVEAKADSGHSNRVEFDVTSAAGAVIEILLDR